MPDILTDFLTLLPKSGAELTALDVFLRLLCALLVGIVIGTEREYTHRPAGMRTHMLVSLGACIVMLTGELIFMEYHALGAAPDPARMAAQVIAGVGFLGAGTILREGPTVKGLTTAASLWATACLGLAAGAGYYLVALAGMLFIFLTLTLFELIQRKLPGTRPVVGDYTVTTANLAACMQVVSNSEGIACSQVQIQPADEENCFTVTFRAEFNGYGRNRIQQQFLQQLASADGTRGVFTAEHPHTGR